MGYVYAIANQKGGVGKTTTTVNLAACIAETGRQTLVVDLDPQCNATVTLGLDREARPSTYDTLCGDVSIAEAARPTDTDNLWVVPANRDLAGAVGRAARPRALRVPAARRPRPGPRALRRDVPRLPAVARARSPSTRSPPPTG